MQQGSSAAYLKTTMQQAGLQIKGCSWLSSHL